MKKVLKYKRSDGTEMRGKVLTHLMSSSEQPPGMPEEGLLTPIVYALMMLAL